jgi:hypothetical protein
MIFTQGFVEGKAAERRKDLVPFDAKSLIHMVRLAGSHTIYFAH